MHRTPLNSRIVASVFAGALASSVLAQTPPPNYDFRWSTVANAGNAPYPGGEFGGNAGRGRVDYPFRISQLETNTGQWIEFLNAVSPLFPSVHNFGRPAIWAAQTDPSYPGPGDRYVLDPNHANPAMVPLYGTGWRNAAMFCNWLCNNKGTTLAAVQNGAYDISTFTANPDGTLNDQLAHNPGAQFWIPTLDEWLKAAHYDPDKNGPGQPGWWQYPNRSYQPLTPGPPGQGQTSALLNLPQNDQFFIPVGSYAPLASAYGLLDTSGAGSEWLEDADITRTARLADGTRAGGTLLNDRADVTDNGLVLLPYEIFAGIRIASAIPTPHSALPLALLWLARRRRKGFAHEG